ncbi:MAG: hypothetical protein AB7O59_02625 [Pirellulales bacterium]
MNSDAAPLAWVLVLAVVGLSGCQPAPREICGRVTLAGQPLDEAVILFVPLEQGQRKTGAPIRRGRYHVLPEDGLLPGPYRVEILDNPPLDHAPAPGTVPPTGQTGSGKSARRRIPYQYAHDSALRIELTGNGPQTFDFDLVAEP